MIYFSVSQSIEIAYLDSIVNSTHINIPADVIDRATESSVCDKSIRTAHKQPERKNCVKSESDAVSSLKQKSREDRLLFQNEEFLHKVVIFSLSVENNKYIK